MKRLSRHTVVVLVVLMLSCVGGMSVAVVAFGQSGGDPDATVPLGDYTGTTTTPSSAPTSSYTTTVNTTATTITPTNTSTQNQEQSGAGSSPVTSQGSKGSTGHGTTTQPGATSGPLPSRATRSGPTHLAFTGGEPLIVGVLGLALMAGGFGLHLQRRRRRGLR